jgi:hypothetical protein
MTVLRLGGAIAGPPRKLIPHSSFKGPESRAVKMTQYLAGKMDTPGAWVALGSVIFAAVCALSTRAECEGLHVKFALEVGRTRG